MRTENVPLQKISHIAMNVMKHAEKAFTEFARRYGEEELLDCLERNEKNGVVYHREGINGDYDDFDDVKALIEFIRTGIRG